MATVTHIHNPLNTLAAASNHDHEGFQMIYMNVVTRDDDNDGMCRWWLKSFFGKEVQVLLLLLRMGIARVASGPEEQMDMMCCTVVAVVNVESVCGMRPFKYTYSGGRNDNSPPGAYLVLRGRRTFIVSTRENRSSNPVRM